MKKLFMVMLITCISVLVIFTGTSFIYAADPLEVTIDIKPGEDNLTNPINLKAKGKVPVAVFSSNAIDSVLAFDATMIDPATVLFAGAPSVKSVLKDVNLDGLMDVVFFFNTQSLILDSTSTSATLTASTTDGSTITGTDSVKIVPKPKIPKPKKSKSKK